MKKTIFWLLSSNAIYVAIILLLGFIFDKGWVFFVWIILGTWLLEGTIVGIIAYVKKNKIKDVKIFTGVKLTEEEYYSIFENFMLSTEGVPPRVLGHLNISIFFRGFQSILVDISKQIVQVYIVHFQDRDLPDKYIFGMLASDQNIVSYRLVDHVLSDDEITKFAKSLAKGTQEFRTVERFIEEKPNVVSERSTEPAFATKKGDDIDA